MIATYKSTIANDGRARAPPSLPLFKRLLKIHEKTEKTPIAAAHGSWLMPMEARDETGRGVTSDPPLHSVDEQGQIGGIPAGLGPEMKLFHMPLERQF